jgi:chromosome segregation ATPase
MNLSDFKPDDPILSEDKTSRKSGSGLARTEYQEEVNALKIDKLSNKITIISIIIPVMIGAILVFAYLDMKERVVDVDQTKQSQVDLISKQLEEKLNALDIKIAKNTFELEKTLPELQNKTTSLDGRLTKLSSEKADNQTVNNNLSSLKKSIKTNAQQDEATMVAVDKNYKSMLAKIKANQKEYNQLSKQIQEEIALFKEEFDARLLELSDYEQQVGELRKDLSLLDKKWMKLDKDMLKKSEFQSLAKGIQDDMTKLKDYQDKQIIELKKQLSQIQTSLSDRIKTFSKKMESAASGDSTAPGRPKPQIVIETPPDSGVSEKPLTQ